TNNLGIKFQTAIAKAPAFDYRPTLDTLKGQLETAMKLSWLFSKKDFNHLRNNYNNFSVLYDMADRGHLRIQQRLYQAFREATPSKYYDKEDESTNQIYMTHKHVDWGFLA